MGQGFATEAKRAVFLANRRQRQTWRHDLRQLIEQGQGPQLLIAQALGQFAAQRQLCDVGFQFCCLRGLVLQGLSRLVQVRMALRLEPVPVVHGQACHQRQRHSRQKAQGHAHPQPTALLLPLAMWPSNEVDAVHGSMPRSANPQACR